MLIILLSKVLVRLCSLGQSQSRTFWCTSAEAKPFCLSQTKVVGATGTACKDDSLGPQQNSSRADLHFIGTTRRFGRENPTSLLTYRFH